MGFFKGLGKVGLGLLDVSGAVGMGVGKAGVKVAGAVGAPTTHFASKAPLKFAAAIGAAGAMGFVGSDLAGEDPKEGTKRMATAGFVAASLGGAGAVTSMGAGMLGAAAGLAGTAGYLGEKMIKMPKGKVGLGNLNEIKMHKAAFVPILMAAAIGGIFSAEKEFEKSRMGTNDGMMRTATPMLPQITSQGSTGYDNGGASGDLVFAMHNNR